MTKSSYSLYTDVSMFTDVSKFNYSYGYNVAIFPGLSYARSKSENITGFCTGMNGSASCGLLTKYPNPLQPRCKFVNCSEKHAYICGFHIPTGLCNCA